jgi:prepilin-type N-terminal cleavage/methylation domain-containing protein
MRRVFAWLPRDRRQAQAGQSLVEVLVAITIMGLALTIVVGTFSTGLLQAALAKRNTAAAAALQYELDQVSGGPYDPTPQSYSDCFATETASAPFGQASGYQGTCPLPGPYALRVDVKVAAGPSSNTQLWSVTVYSLTNATTVGRPVQIIKASR